MDSSERYRHIRHRTVDPSPRSVNPTSHHDQIDHFHTVHTPHGDYERNHGKIPGSRSLGRHRQSSQIPPGRYFSGEEDMYDASPFPTESSWPEDEYQTPHYSFKRGRSPSTIDDHPNKRAHSYAPPMGMQPPPTSQRGMFSDEGPSDPEGYWNPLPYSTDNFPTPHPSTSHSSSQRRQGIDRHDLQAYHSPSYGYDSVNHKTYIADRDPRYRAISEVRNNDRQLVRRSQTIASEARQGFGDLDFHSPDQDRIIGSAQPQLQSPIWNAGPSRPQSRRRRAGTAQTSPQAPQRSNDDMADREFPFCDGGIHGDGGSSSDDEIMTDPSVGGRDVYPGGYRGKTKAATYGAHKSGSLDYHPFERADLDAIWDANDRVTRRKTKLLARQLKAEWDAAKKNGDVAAMIQIEQRAKREKIPHGRKEPIRDGNRLSQSPPPQSQSPQHHPEGFRAPIQTECHTHSPHSRALVPFDEQQTHSHLGSRDYLRHATENSRAQSQNRHPRTPTTNNGVRSENRVSIAPELHEQGDWYDAQEFPDGQDQDPTPLDQKIRQNRQHSQHANVDGSLYRAKDVLPIASINFNNRSRRGKIKHGPPQVQPRAYNYRGDPFDGDQTVSASPSTPRSHLRPRANISDQKQKDSPEIISLLSSAEDTPAPKRSEPMKSRLEPRPNMKAVPKRSKLSTTTNASAAKEKKTKANGDDPEVTRQKMCAERIVATELKAANEDLEKRVFGEVIGLTPEEAEQRAEVKRKEAQRKEELRLQEEIAKEEAHIAEMQKQKELEEAREQERLDKEREELSKKKKREAERARQLQLEEKIKEEKRKKALGQIEAMRVKEEADAEAREKEREKKRTIEADALKLEILRKDLEIKRLQAQTLSGTKHNSPDSPRNSASKGTPTSAVADNEESLFVSGNPPNTNNIDDETPTRSAGTDVRSMHVFLPDRSFLRTMLAQDRKLRQMESALELIKRSAAAKNRLETSRKSIEPTREKQKQAKQPKKSRRGRTQNNTGSGSEEPDNAIHTLDQSSPVIKHPTKSALRHGSQTHPVHSGRESGSAPVSSTSSIAVPAVPKTYASEVRLLRDLQVEEKEKRRKAKEEAHKQQKQAERRQRDLANAALRHRNKITEEAKEGGYTLTDQEIELRVSAHMKKLEREYQRKQARKAERGGVGTEASFNSYFTPQDQPQPSTQPQSSSQPQAEESYNWFTGAKTNNQQADQDNASQASEPDLLQSLADANAAKRQRRGRVTTVQGLSAEIDENIYQSSDEESEEDPDDEEMAEAERAAKTGAKTTSNGENLAAGASASIPHEGSVNTGTVSQNATSRAPGDSSQGLIAAADSHIPNSEEPDIRIYKVTKTEIKDGEELDEYYKKLHVRQEANSMAKDWLKEYAERANTEEQSSQSFLKDGLFHGSVMLDDENSMTVEVTSEFAKASEYAGLDVSKISNIYSEKVWVITRELKKTHTDENTGHTSVTFVAEHADGHVYTDRGFANHEAAWHLIRLIKPKEGDENLEHEEEWTAYQKRILESLEEQDEGGRCFEAEVEREEPTATEDGEVEKGTLVWLEWDTVGYKVEVKETKGPRN